ncbi:MAG: D-glycero-beta-D-manno-heptose-7-phosphate kinase [Pseudarcicella sp.]|nr:D-glycero-beta-D-manno-heptose-7-phosphate kinase [Pseudarcicella sp.]
MQINETFDRFNDLKILIIGDLMIDAYIWGKVDRISPEAPVPVVNVKKRENRLGGAGNVVLNIQSLGATPIVCSVIGNDPAGDALFTLFEEKNISTDGIIRSENRPTTIKERIIAGTQQIARIDSETTTAISSEETNQLINKIKNLASNVDVIVFEDYDKGVITENLITEIIDFANTNNIPTVVDPKKRNFLFYRNATLFKPNLKELKEGLGIEFDVNNDTELKNVVDLLKSKMNLNGVFLTLSEKGVYIDFNNNKISIPAHIRQIADVSGAGDTVISIAACCLALQLEPEKIAGLANLGGGLVCEKLGVVPIDKVILLNEATKIFES